MKRIVLLITAVTVLLTASGCKSSLQDSFIAMDTAFALNLTGDNANAAAQEIESEIKRLEGLFSVTDENSEISAINQSDGFVKVSDETVQLIDRAKEISLITDGCFDISIYPVVELWGFTKDENKVPTDIEINTALTKVGYEKIVIADDGICFDGKLDPGGIAKGYACDAVREILEKNGVKKGIVSSGSSILLKGGDFTVGIQHPVKSDKLICTLSAADTCVVTSGGYQRNFEQDGKVYHHIIDPKTGFPADNGIISATVLCEDGTLADGLSTALYIMGVDKAIELYKSQDSFEMVLITENEIYSTVDIDVKDSDYKLNIVK